jgi:hypothetical protein
MKRERERERALGADPFSASGGVGSHPIFGMLESVDVNPATVLFVPALRTFIVEAHVPNREPIDNLIGNRNFD